MIVVDQGGIMFLRSVKASNRRHEYLRLVENYRQGEKTRQRVVLHIVHNAMIDRCPAIIARCAGVADVTAAVKFARKHGVVVAIRVE
jgi:hypothetical protein